MSDDTDAGPYAAGERATLAGFLQRQRDTLVRICAGLTAAQLRDRPVPTSELTLLGLVRHLAEVERSWFRNLFLGEHADYFWATPEGTRASFLVTDADPDEAFRTWREECARSRAAVAAAPSLDATGHYEGEDYSLRYILTHMIEEYARHNGHAELLRGHLDGATSVCTARPADG